MFEVILHHHDASMIELLIKKHTAVLSAKLLCAIDMELMLEATGRGEVRYLENSRRS